MTRAELRTRVLRALNDSPTAPVFWSLAEVNGYLDEALEVLSEEVPAVKRTFQVPRRAGTMVYQLTGVGTDIMAPFRIWLPDRKRRLEAKTLADLDARHEEWLDSVSDGPWWWVALSWDAFLVWPPPTTGEGWMEVNAYVWHPALLDDDDEPELHVSAHPALVTYGEALGYLKQWDAQGCVGRLQQFLGAEGRAQSQADVRQLQEKHWSRGQTRETRRSD